MQTHSTPHVEIVRVNDAYQWQVDGQPYTVKGVGLNWEDGTYFEELVAAGGNTIRTWKTDHLDDELAAAEKYDLMLVVGLPMGQELHGFDYSDAAAVAEQLAQLKRAVDRYKDEPRILAWIPGNELNLLVGEDYTPLEVNPRVWDALREVVDYIHAVDPHHPVGTAFASVYPEHIQVALSLCPDLDFVGLQVYGELEEMPDLVAAAGLTKPYMITEFGPVGHWERPTTAWGREIEEPSAVKARSMAHRMQRGITEETSGLQIGHFAFEWGQKQERTPTWYGMFNKTGEATARIDALTKFWTGDYPAHRAPLTQSIHIDGQEPEESVVLAANASATVGVVVENASPALDYQWVLSREVDERSLGGGLEQEPEELPLQILASTEAGVTFRVPSQPGEYRLFSYVYDGRGKVGNANFPFLVTA